MTIKKIGFIFILLLIFIIAKYISENRYNNKNIDIKKEYTLLKNSLDIDRPGFGKSDYGDFDIVDIPKAYAMLLSSELMKYKISRGEYNLTMVLNAGHWLLNNSDLNKNGVVGWGVPVAWDAFGDNSINEKNAEYTISTGIVLNSLMDWMELAPNNAPRQEIHSAIKQAIKPYLNNNIFSPSGLFNYSLKEEDRKYNCFNAAIYMAGQMQRFTSFISDKALKNEIKSSVDKVMDTAIKYKKLDPKGGWYWSYSMEENTVPNDLAHAGYIVDGIMTYVRYKGRLREQFDKKAVLSHLDFFINKDRDKYYFHPSFFKKNKITPRLYGLGMLLHVYAKYTKDYNTMVTLLNYTHKYKLSSGLYSRWQNEDVVITEYLTYLMYGIASYEYYQNGFGKTIYLHSDKSHMEKIENIFKNAELDKKMQIPLASLSQEGIDVYFDTQLYYSELTIAGKKIVFDKYEAIPIKLLLTKKDVIIILRELLTNHLIIARINKSTNKLMYTKVDNIKNIFSDFREGIIFNSQLVLILYESHKGQNTLLALDINDNFKRITEIKLPSVEDPAGKTYEVIPKMILIKSKKEKKKLNIISGKLFAVYNGSRIKKINTNNDVKVFMEAILGEKDDVYALYRDKQNRYHISNLLTNQNYYSAKKGEIIYGIYYSKKKKIEFKKVNSISDISDLFIYDFLSNKGSGTLYMGSNNLEGWLAWAQVYYLNGMLSFLELAKKDIEFYEVIEKYVPDIKKRLELEMKLFLYQMNSQDSLRCRVFSIDRSLATFAVQTSRFAMLLQRYLRLFPNKIIQKKYEVLKKEILSLDKHMEVMEKGTSNIVSKKWNPYDSYYLRWPKGNKFYFDGLPVPYNHQNEWATFVLKSTNEQYSKPAKSMIKLFINHIVNSDNTLPQDAIWPYWWGKAWDGWSEGEKISLNKRSYSGDTGNGWISFRTIDSISILTLFNHSKDIDIKHIDSIKRYIKEGKIYPFASTSFLDINSLPLIQKSVVAEYIRFLSPWEFDNSVWSYLSFIKGLENNAQY